MSSSRPGKCDSNSWAPRAISRWTCLPCGTAARFAGRRGQVVALVDRHPVVEVGKHPRRAQAGDARPDDDRVFPSPPHRARRYSVHSAEYRTLRKGTRMDDMALADQVGGAVDRGHRRAGDPAAQGPDLVGPHGLRRVGGDRRGHLHHHRVHGGQHHRPGDLDLVRHRRDRLRAGRAVLRRVRLDRAGRGQRLHVLLRDVRRVRRLDHRLGPDPGVRGRRGRRGQGLVELSGHGVRLRRRHSAISAGSTRLGRAADHRVRHHDPGVGHQAVGRGEPGRSPSIKVAVVLLVVVVGAFYIKAANYTPFIPPAECRWRLGHRAVAVLADHRRGGQQLRLVRRAGGRVDRVLRVHRLRHRRHHRRGDQEPAARRAARHPRLAGDRHRALRGGGRRAVGHGALHRARNAGEKANLATAFSEPTAWTGRPR